LIYIYIFYVGICGNISFGHVNKKCLYLLQTMKTTNIYVLIDPETNQIRYVGKANNVSERYRAHLNKARKHQIHKKNWIESLKRKKLKPII